MRDLPHYELSPKYHEALAIVDANAALGRKTLVWSTFVRSLKSLELLLARFNPVIVHGGTEDRSEQLARFRKIRHAWSCSQIQLRWVWLGSKRHAITTASLC
jgi:hypothetical protein